MGKGDFTERRKRGAAAQIGERFRPIAEVSQRVGVSQDSLTGERNVRHGPITGAGAASGSRFVGPARAGGADRGSGLEATTNVGRREL